MRTYKRKTAVRPFTDDHLKRARALIAGGNSVRSVARTLGFNESCVRRKLKAGKGSQKLGRFRRIFTEDQEQEIRNHAIALDKRYFGLTLKSLRFLIFSYAEKNGMAHPFSKLLKMSGKDFTRDFMKRNRLSLRTPRKTSIARSMGFNRTQMSLYFDNLSNAMKKYELTPDRLYNMDETGIQTVPSKIPKHVAPTGKKEVGKSVSAEQGQTVTMVCAMSATGHHIPPYFIYARKRINLQLIRNGPVGCDMNVTDKGYMTSAVFVKWLQHFKKYANPSADKSILLILDNHVSHISLEAVMFAKENNIHLLSLPPHTSHKTQPLDKVFFKPLKAFYDDLADGWITSHPGETLSIYNVAELAGKAFQKAATVEKAVLGFQATGIFPLCPSIFSDEDFLPAEVTDQDFDNQQEFTEEDERVFVVFDENQPEPQPENQPLPPSPIPESQLVVEPENLECDGPHFSVERKDSPNAVPPALHLSASTSAVSPADIIPLPKIKIKRKRSGRGLKSVLLTSTPNKTRLENSEAEKKNKAARKSAKSLFSVSKKKPPARKRSPSSDSSADSNAFSLHNSSSDLDLNELLGEGEGRNEDHLIPGEFAVVEMDNQEMNVAKIVSIYEKGYGCLLYKRSLKSQRFLETKTEAFVINEKVVKVLSKPVLGSSARFQNMISFNDDLTDMNIT